MSKKQYGVVLVVAVVAGLVGSVVSSWFLMGSPVFAQKAPQHEKVLQAEKFEVVDRDGKLRAVLGTDPSGSVNLLLYDRAGKQGAGQFGMLPNGNSGLLLYDQAGKIRATLQLLDGEPSLDLSGKDEKPRVQLFTTDGEPRLRLLDQAGKLRAALGIFDGEPGLSFLDKEGKQRVMLFTTDGEPRLELLDKNEEIRAILGYTELALRTGSTEKRAVSSLVLLDKDGKVLWI